ncbi:MULTISPECIES: LytR/AlgR family response regulator transcription factor [Clostridium]|uniref:LytR/AlgR family response regulator transcription factor n=1 Tax=Clostridium TaxID=1485 RepID=UPI00069FDE7C|nr:LytTR family DNA-binding domain-containing protein [Clostridium sp. DMHC 10]KOF55774.1 transcriptional regulator [Clostridium sp. DMHC 10]MCD2346086.1 LytTR family DNA-binding domain-containing protein [Clostridium guangxiense]
MNKIRCIVVEDEIPAMDELEFILNKYEDIQIINRFYDGKAAASFIKKEIPDVIFLDINIPVLNGMKLAKMIKEFNENIAIIFVTAYDKYAISAFELMALDYILKPFDENRIEKTIQRIRRYMQLRENNINNIENEIEQIIKKYNKNNISNINKIPCINNSKIILIDTNDIFFCYIIDEKTCVKLDNKVYITTNSLSEIEEKTGFFRTHRSYLVNLNKVIEIYSWFNGTYKLIMNDNNKSEVPVSRAHVKEFKKVIHI